MLILEVSKVSKNFGYGTLFKNLSFSLNEGEKISVVGQNGCGKSTLLKMIFGTEKIDSGSISIKKGVKVAYLDQTAPDKHDKRMVKEVLLDAYKPILDAEEEMQKLLTKIEEDPESDECTKWVEEYSALQEKFTKDGGYNIETNINIVTNGLNISDDILNSEYDVLSGGEKTLIHMAKSLCQQPDLILLDEPTNHLDINRIEWLEEYVKSFNGAAVIVSHDRVFLDKVSDKILEIDKNHSEIYSSNYSQYLVEKEERYNKQLMEYKMQQDYFDKLEKQYKRFADAGMATNSTAITRKASVIKKRLEREKEQSFVPKPEATKKISLSFEEVLKNSKHVIEVLNLCISTENRVIVEDVNMDILKGERIVLIGSNGSGKSTIIKAIMNESPLDVHGEVKIAPSVKIGYLPQLIEFDDDSENLLEYFRLSTGLSEERSRSILSRFLFSKEDVQKNVGRLSGGERIRVRLAILLQNQVNTLIFDEPTNHIDIPTKEALENAIDGFDGTVIAVSHDRYFINKVAHKVVEVKNKHIRTFIGDYNNYLSKC